MDDKRGTMILYTAQSTPVLRAIERDGVCFSRAEYVRRKYGESAPLFLTVYGWFVQKAAERVPPPEGAQFPYWAFAETSSIDLSSAEHILTLEVPRDQAVFFDVFDWNRILQLRYLGENEKQEREFRQELELRGLDNQKVMLSSFYPEWKGRILESWERLFRWHERICAGDTSCVGSVQAGLWCIRREWIVSGL